MSDDKFWFWRHLADFWRLASRVIFGRTHLGMDCMVTDVGIFWDFVRAVGVV